MNIEKILDFFYEKGARRIKLRIKELKITYEDICETDPKQISWIVNNKRTKNNRFLICDTVLYGIKTKLRFANEQEVLWGSKKEIENYLPDFFKLLWDELPDKNSEYQIDKDFILYDYVPYAENSVYYGILSNFEYNDSFFALYGKPDVDILRNQEIFKQEAFNYLYLKCAKEFKKIFDEFCSATNSFHKIDKVFKKEFIDTVFINLIKKNIPDESSLGLRVKNIIENDLSQSADLIIKHRKTGQFDEMKKRLLNAASTYALRLEEIQNAMIENLKSEQ